VGWQIIALVKMFNWQNLAIGLLALAARRHFFRLSHPLRDLGWGLGLTYLSFFFILGNLGHGWGFRYGHAVLGNFVLLAVAGGIIIQEALGMRSLKHLVAAATVFVVAVDLPIRTVQAERFIRPFAEAMTKIEQTPADIVLVDIDSAWYAHDLVRNHPYLTNHPLVMHAEDLTREQIAELRKRCVVRAITSDEFSALGMFHVRPPAEERPAH
jgi:hypothetical protein